MRRRIFIAASLALLVALGVASQAAAQSTTTGSIRGTVTDSEGGVLPGATVTATSDALVAGRLTAVTDQRGLYRFPALPPGIYVIEVTLPGFRTVRQENVRVTITQTLNVDLQMAVATVAEEITVVAEAPTVSTVSNNVTSTLTTEYLDRQPLPRNVNALINYAPGVNSSRAYGATEERDNAYNLDGVDISDPGSGEHWLLPNFDWLQEVQVSGLGAAAEYGGFTGAVFNLVTKSGGNTFHGDASVYYTGDLFGRNLVARNAPTGGDVSLQPSRLASDTDVSLSLGGAIKRDVLWYFVSGEERRTDEEPFQPAEIVAFESARNSYSKLSRYLAKLTYQMNPANRFVALADYDGKYEDRRGLDYQTLASAAQKQESPNYSYSLMWDSVVNAANFFSMKFTGFTGKDDRLPYNGLDTPGHIDANTGYAWGNYNYDWKYRPKRWSVDVSWNLFADSLFGGGDSHSFKFGANYERGTVSETRVRTGGFTYYDDSYYCDSIDEYFTDPFCGVYSTDVGNEIHLRSKQTGINLYAQDSMRLERLTINYGVRYTHYKAGFDNVSGDPYDVDMVAPRIGVVWDVRGNGRTALKAHYGRYYEGLYAYLYDRYDKAGVFTPYSYCDYDFDTGAYDICGVLSTNSAAMDSNIKHPYTDQVVVTLEQQVGNDSMVGVDYIVRRSRDLIAMVNTNNDYEDLQAPDNPLTGAPLPFYDLQTPPSYLLTNPSGAYRDYDAVMLRFQKRYSYGWLLDASLVYADLEGNTYSSDGYASEWSDLNGRTNASGRLPGYNKWEFKLSGSVDLPYEFQASAYYTYLSGEYWTPQVQIRGLYENGRPYVYMEQRGAEKLPSRSVVDLRLAKVFKLGGGTRLNLFVDAFNVFNSETVTGVNSTWGRYYYDYPNPPAADGWDGPRSGYKVPLSIEAPREIRLGARLSF